MNPLSFNGQQVPIITSSPQGGVTARHSVPPSPVPANGQNSNHGQSAALLDKVRALDALPRLGALRTLDLRGNDIRTGITYISQVLKRNRTLKVLNLSENKLDVQGLVAIAEALKYNSCLETLDLSKNPCCGPSLEGVQSLRTAFTLNNALKRLFLSSTMLSSAGAIALAEFLPESTSLLHLDLTMNNLDLAGVMALNSGLKANHTMRCLDLNIPPADEEMARMCRDILNTCVRNTEEAEKASHPPHTEAISGRGQAKGVWVMIEESELAKTFRKGDKQKVEEHVYNANSSHILQEDGTDQILSSTEQRDSDIVMQARSCKMQLDNSSARTPSSSSSPASPVVDVDPELKKRARVVLQSLGAVIEATDDPTRLEELLELNDELTSSLARCNLPRPGLKLTGLGISVPNGDVEPILATSESPTEFEEDEPVTPRVDKGKARAEPEPELPEKVLSPTLAAPEDYEDAEQELGLTGQIESIVSPTDRSRSWVAEEGEVFRKGAVLLTTEEMEGEYDGEELRKELLEAMVERPPPRALHDGFDDLPVESPTSSVASPTDPKKPSPRPYIRRTRSSSSTIGAVNNPESPTIPDTLHEAA
ncbi:hypothetical protein EW026_g7934 [Hermanssonia centrifuga]|nr:hypothetical protein EW026_g7934 [Hermanssonia centrifuga]